MNPSRCIAFHTIEATKGIPEELKDKFRDRIYGCEICQDVCPYNRFAIPHHEPDFLPDERLKTMRKKDWYSLSEDQFEDLFKNSPVSRIGYEKLMDTVRYLSPQ